MRKATSPDYFVNPSVCNVCITVSLSYMTVSWLCAYCSSAWCTCHCLILNLVTGPWWSCPSSVLEADLRSSSQQRGQDYTSSAAVATAVQPAVRTRDTPGKRKAIYVNKNARKNVGKLLIKIALRVETASSISNCGLNLSTIKPEKMEWNSSCRLQNKISEIN